MQLDGSRIAVDPASVRLFWRAAGGGAYAEVPMAPAGADSFAAVFPAVGADGDYEYYRYIQAWQAYALFALLFPVYGVVIGLVAERLAGKPAYSPHRVVGIVGQVALGAIALLSGIGLLQDLRELTAPGV